MHKTLIVLCAAAGCALSEEPDLSSMESALSPEQWDDGRWVDHAQRSNYQVGLASFGGRLHMLYRTDNLSGGVWGSVNRPELKWSRFNGTSWSEPVQLDALQADYGPSMTVWNDQLVTIYNSYGENRLLMSTSRGQEWSTPVTAGTSLGTSKLAYAPAVVNYRNVLYVAYCREDSDRDRVQVDRFNGYEWTSAATFDVTSPWKCKSVAAAALPGPKFRLVWNYHDPRTFGGHIPDWRVSEVSGSAVTSNLVRTSLSDETGNRSKKPMSIAHCDGVTHLLHGGYGDPEDIRWQAIENGQWGPSLWVPGKQSYGGAQLACFGTRPIMVHNMEDESLLRMSEFRP